MEEEPVFKVSLLRSLTLNAVKGQFKRIAHGGNELTNYNFKFLLNDPQSQSMTFDVQIEQLPPTNIHVIIGRNGVGKTTLFNLVSEEFKSEANNTIHFEPENDENTFSSLLTIKLDSFGGEGFSDKEYRQSLMNIKANGKKQQRFIRALHTIESDPVFKSLDFPNLFKALDQGGNASSIDIFNDLSSGHKAVFWSVVKLVDFVMEKSLVLIDEPENHLHPPLLSAFIRALSDLLIEMNGVAVLATHSPVVLQEVSKNCVWIMNRNGEYIDIQRPEIETFGENLSSLTREVFSLEVTSSGFHHLLKQEVESGGSYKEICSRFNDSLGSDARVIVRSMVNTRDKKSD